MQRLFDINVIIQIEGRARPAQTQLRVVLQFTPGENLRGQVRVDESATEGKILSLSYVSADVQNTYTKVCVTILYTHFEYTITLSLK